MKQNPFKRKNYWNRPLSLSILFFFLTLGFCPLRNALTHAAQPIPVAGGTRVPEYSKIIAHDDCSVAVITKTLPTTGRLFTDLLSPALAEITPLVRFDQPWIKTLASVQLPSEVQTAAFPIYLRNRALLI